MINNILLCLVITFLLSATSGERWDERDEDASVVGRLAKVVALPGRHPYFAHLQICVPDGVPSCFICGGTLIRSDIILTAAQCYRKGASISVRVNVSNPNDGVRRTVEKMIPHPGYNESFENDIMVLKLKTPLSSIVPVKLNKLSYLPLPNASLKLFGFGAHSESNPAPSRRLREVSVLAGDFDKCNQQYQSRLSSGLHLCTVAMPGSGGDSCEGDGGAPLIIKSHNRSVDIQVGVVSFGSGCGRRRSYSGYSKVSGYAAWIEKQMCDISGDKSGCP